MVWPKSYLTNKSNLRHWYDIFMHLADAFIQSNLHCIQATHFIRSCIPCRVPTLSWRPDSRTFKDFFKHHLFYIKHLSNSHASICNVMKDLTVLNISLTLNIYIKNFRVIMFWMCRFHKFRPFWAVVFKGL